MAAASGGINVSALASSLGSLTAGFTGVATLVGGPVAGALVNFAQTMVGIPQMILASVKPFIQAFNPASIERLMMAFEDVRAAIGSMLMPIMPLFQSIAQQLNILFTSIAPVLLPVIQQVAGVLQTLGNAFMTVLSQIVQGALPAFQAAFQAIQPILAALLPVFAQLAEIVMSTQAAMQPMRDAVVSLIGALAPAVGPLISAILSVVSIIWQFQGLITKIVVTALAPLLAIITPIISAIASGLQSGMAILDSVMGAVGGLVTSLMELFMSINPAFALFQWLLPVFTSTLQSLVNAVRSAANAIRAVVDVIGNPRQWGDFIANIGRRFNELQRGPQVAGGPLRGPQTFAAREASFTGIEEVGRQAQLAAFGAATIQERQLEEAQAMRQIMEEILRIQTQGRDRGLTPAEMDRLVELIQRRDRRDFRDIAVGGGF